MFLIFQQARVRGRRRWNRQHRNPYLFQIRRRSFQRPRRRRILRLQSIWDIWNFLIFEFSGFLIFCSDNRRENAYLGPISKLLEDQKMRESLIEAQSLCFAENTLSMERSKWADVQNKLLSPIASLLQANKRSRLLQTFSTKQSCKYLKRETEADIKHRESPVKILGLPKCPLSRP